MGYYKTKIIKYFVSKYLKFCIFELIFTKHIYEKQNHSVTDNFIVCNAVLASPPVRRNCSNGEVRLYQNTTFISEGFESLNGLLEICVRGQFTPVCGTEENSATVMDIAQRICRANNYNGIGVNYKAN